MSASAPSTPIRRKPAAVLPALSLAKREIVRFFRQRSRVIGAMGTPLIFWLVLGSGMAGSFKASEAAAEGGSIAFFFPGMILLTILFASIYSTISIIEDRLAGFLQSVLVSPVPRLSLVMGKLLGGTVLAMLQGVALLLLAPLAGVPLSLSSAVLAVVWLSLVSLTLTGLGFVIAWRMESTAGFHGIINLLMMPMWMLSGAIFPIAGAHGWLQWIMRFNPLTYGMSGLWHVLYGSTDTPVPEGTPSLPLCIAVTLAFGILIAWASSRSVAAKVG